ncbi:MAG: flagellar basal body rod protein FlgB, partial [Clostridia bacterium]|nr:flagellar basal body rod protein FlgB [Clostridia bacterium]
KITQGSMRVDGNNVDLEEEMTNLAMNGINYNFATRMLNNKISNIRHVVSEGRR